MFLSHPIEEKKYLADHCITVAKKTKEILDETSFEISDIGFYAGLLHDIGKLNPFYQILFSTEKKTRDKKLTQLQETYLREHSRFSAWAANYLLENLDYDTIDIISAIIAAHHTRLTKTISQPKQSDILKRTQLGLFQNLELFKKENIDNVFSKLNWKICLEMFRNPISFQASLEDACPKTIESFVKLGVLFSALLQADRGSFTDWNKPKYDLKINTTGLVKTDSELYSIRNEFAQQIMTKYDFDSIKVLQAPTGIGKTKIFLDLIYEYEKRFSLERVFYFSPLLALTDDFESKISETVSNKDLAQILSYNHLFSGSLEQKERYETGEQEKYQWVFEDESFNQKFVITTTQRLMMTMYSNSHSDKIKLASMKNSLLIVDEVQTIPKFLIPNFIEQLKIFAERMGTKVILVSATVPDELELVPRVQISNDLVKQYLQKTRKDISFSTLNVSNFKDQKILVMANTKKKASTIFSDLAQSYTGDNVFYLSTGVVKQDRLDVLKKLKDLTECLCVSTQVIESGVDISFSQIFREAAPLDNIIQVMGRLNREGKYDNALLTVFQYDKDWKPYSRLEFEESLSLIGKISSSTDLYDILPQYYRTIREKNKLNKMTSEDLTDLMKKMDYQKVWDLIYNSVFAEDYQETVFILKSKEMWKEFKDRIMYSGKMTKDISRKFSYYTASLAKSPEKLGILDMFDDDLLEKKILLPKQDMINDVYDARIGLDKWLL